MKDASTSDRLLHTLQQHLQDGNISSTTLVFTFFCDVVTQHGGEIWLGSIIQTLAPLGINDRLTRTAVYRLVQEGWIESRKHGRRSYYRLTSTGRNYYQRAASRIYASGRPDWNGQWSLLFIAMVPEDRRDSLHRGLSWLGYGRLAAGVYALPGKDRPALKALLSDLGIEDTIVQMQAHTDDTNALQKLVLNRWKLAHLRQRYGEFIARYKHINALIAKKKSPSGHKFLLLRILLIHEYRRILLSDPELPAAMLPSDWEGYTAQHLTASLYRLALPTSRLWVMQTLQNAQGFLGDGPDTSESRFTT